MFMKKVIQKICGKSANCIVGAVSVAVTALSTVSLPLALAVVATFVGGSEVFAAVTTGVAAPGTTGFGQVLYTAGVVGILQGPIGHVVGTGIFVGAGYLLYKQEVMGGAMAALGALAILNADAIVSSMTAII